MARAWYFTSTPEGLPTLDNVALAEMPPQDIGPNQIRVRNEYLSVDPYMRGRMTTVKSYVPGFEVDQPMTGGAVVSYIDGTVKDLSGTTHVTIQNKVAPNEAKALLVELEAVFVPHPLDIAGLAIWRYVGGPWEPVGAWRFGNGHSMRAPC